MRCAAYGSSLAQPSGRRLRVVGGYWAAWSAASCGERPWIYGCRHMRYVVLPLQLSEGVGNPCLEISPLGGSLRLRRCGAFALRAMAYLLRIRSKGGRVLL
jgi:hypothetical protein